MHHVSALVLSHITQCPFIALSLQEALCAFGVPFGSPGVVAIARPSTPIYLADWHVVAVYDAKDLRGVTAGLLRMWSEEVCTAFALVALISSSDYREYCKPAAKQSHEFSLGSLISQPYPFG